MQIEGLMASALAGPVNRGQFIDDIAKVAASVRKEEERITLKLDLESITSPFFYLQK